MWISYSGRIADLEVAAKEALTYIPEESSIYYNVANAFGKDGQYQESEKYFLHAIRLDPRNPGYHSNLGQFACFYFQLFIYFGRSLSVKHIICLITPPCKHHNFHHHMPCRMSFISCTLPLAGKPYWIRVVVVSSSSSSLLAVKSSFKWLLQNYFTDRFQTWHIVGKH